MIGLRAIASYIPPGRLSNYARREEFDLSDDFIRGKLGVEQVSRLAPGEETSTLCVNALTALQGRMKLDPAAVECLIVCTQNPDGHGIPHTSAVVHGAIGASDECAAFDIGLGCSGYVYGLSVATSFMEANRMTRGLLFTADPYSKILDPSDKNTVLLFGDAATVTLLEEGLPGDGAWYPTRFVFATRGKDGQALSNASGRLHMNGRAVFTFSATAVPPQVEALLAQAGMTKKDVDFFLLHQGSRYVVETLMKRLALPASKVPCHLAEQGNTVSSSVPLLLERYFAGGGQGRILLSGFGVGLSWASCLLERRPGAPSPSAR